MVSLYKDPGGKSIVLNTTCEKEFEGKSTSAGTANGMEMKKLQRRITELEISLQQHVSSLCLLPMHKELTALTIRLKLYMLASSNCYRHSEN